MFVRLVVSNDDRGIKLFLVPLHGGGFTFPKTAKKLVSFDIESTSRDYSVCPGLLFFIFLDSRVDLGLCNLCHPLGHLVRIERVVSYLRYGEKVWYLPFVMVTPLSG